MRVPVSWLRDFIRTDAQPPAFAEALTSRGFTVDSITVQPTPEHIVVGRIETLSRHPNADRLLVSTVDVGQQKLQIVTGATNVTVGDKVPIALAGATSHITSREGSRADHKVRTSSGTPERAGGVSRPGSLVSASAQHVTAGSLISVPAVWGATASIVAAACLA